MPRTSLPKRFALLALVVLLFVPAAASAQTRVKAPRNFFGVDDDVKAGEEAAREIERETKRYHDPEVEDYVERVGRRLVEAIPEQYRRRQFEYTFHVIEDKDANAFALPGGRVYVNSGLLETAGGEGELAGVLAHEISHVALRHGTASASKAVIAQLGVAILGEIIGGKKGEAIQLGAYAGSMLYLMKFSRDYEKQADILGAQIMSRAGYDPHDMVQLFRRLEEGGGKGLPQWLSDHPDLEKRARRIEEEAALLPASDGEVNYVASFERIKERVRTMPDARARRARAAAGLRALDN
ncbi:MAG TPA: M48 family metallopeptidase [Pyrinomonadaceae bacterium]|nr:M48 family metallopeptidase [Pyrinomonadaceae bacterium]